MSSFITVIKYNELKTISMINTERRKASGGLTEQTKLANKLFPTKSSLGPLINNLMLPRPRTLDLTLPSLPPINHRLPHQGTFLQ